MLALFESIMHFTCIGSNVYYFCLITDLETILPGCEPHNGGVICFGFLLWFSLLLKDIFWSMLFSEVECKMQE